MPSTAAAMICEALHLQHLTFDESGTQPILLKHSNTNQKAPNS